MLLVSQEAGSSTGGLQKSVKTGVANALLAMLKCVAAEAVPWRRKVVGLCRVDLLAAKDVRPALLLERNC